MEFFKLADFLSHLAWVVFENFEFTTRALNSDSKRRFHLFLHLSYAHRQMARDCHAAVADLQKFCGLITAASVEVPALAFGEPT
jgi:hypothetical protein